MKTLETAFSECSALRKWLELNKDYDSLKNVNDKQTLLAWFEKNGIPVAERRLAVLKLAAIKFNAIACAEAIPEDWQKMIYCGYKKLYPREDVTANPKFASVEAAVSFWSLVYRPLSVAFEHGALLYQVMEDDKSYYTYGYTYTGVKNNVILGFLSGYLAKRIWLLPLLSTIFLGSPLCGVAIDLIARRETIPGNYRLCGFIHTHPLPEPGYYNNFPSSADLLLLKLPGIKEVYVVPYDNRGLRLVDNESLPNEIPISRYCWQDLTKLTRK